MVVVAAERHEVVDRVDLAREREADARDRDEQQRDDGDQTDGVVQVEVPAVRPRCRRMLKTFPPRPHSWPVPEVEAGEQHDEEDDAEPGLGLDPGQPEDRAAVEVEVQVGQFLHEPRPNGSRRW